MSGGNIIPEAESQLRGVALPAPESGAHAPDLQGGCRSGGEGKLVVSGLPGSAAGRRSGTTGNRHVCSVARGARTSRSSRPSTSSTSRCSRRSGNPLIGSYLGLDFVTEGRSLILHGKTGRGKTHLAVAIGYRAIQNGFETLFTTAAELIEDLSNASKKGNLQESLATYTHPHVLVIDEVGYLTYGPDAANVLFHVVNDRHLRKRPMIFTTNKPLNEWGKVLHDEDMAAAILDRVLERGRFIHLDGPSGEPVISTWKRSCRQYKTAQNFRNCVAQNFRNPHVRDDKKHG